MSGKNASVGVGRVVVGTSGSPGSLRALRYAEVVARAHDVLLVPAIAWVPPEGDRAGPRSSSSGDLRKVWQEMAWQRLRDALIAVWGKVPDDPMVEPHVERGATGWVLVSLACRRGDLLVVGAGRRGALARTVSCRVSRYCVAHAQCPVLSIPPAALAQEVRHGPHAWAFWHRALTPDRVLQDQARPAGLPVNTSAARQPFSLHRLGEETSGPPMPATLGEPPPRASQRPWTVQHRG